MPTKGAAERAAEQAQDWLDDMFEGDDIDEVVSGWNSFETCDYLMDAFKAGYLARDKEKRR